MTIAKYQIFSQIPSQIRHFSNIHSSLLPFLSQEMSYIDMNRILPVKVSGVSPKSLSKIVDFTAELQRCESWEDVPLEFDRLSIDTVIISVSFLGHDPCNSVLPSFVGIWMLKDPPEAQHRI